MGVACKPHSCPSDDIHAPRLPAPHPERCLVSVVSVGPERSGLGGGQRRIYGAAVNWLACCSMKGPAVMRGDGKAQHRSLI